MDLDSKRHSPRTRSSKRKYHAKKNATGARTTIVALGVQPPTSPPQIAHVAFNIHGWGTTDPMSGRRGLFEVINAQKATMVRGGFAAKIAELQCKNSCDIYRQDLTYTARELDTTLPGRDPGVVPYLVVGYTLQEDDPVFISNKTYERYSEGEMVGEETPSAQHLIDWRACRTPVLVVTPVKVNTGTSVRLFGLVLPRSGLCQPVLLQHARIFYRWEFRASAGSRADQRNKNWNQIVINKALELDPGSRYGTQVAALPALEIVDQGQWGSDIYVKREYDQEMDLRPENFAASSTDIVFQLDNLFRPKVLPDGPTVVVDVPTTTHVRMISSSEVRAVISHIRGTSTERVENELRKALLGLNLLTQESEYPNLSRFPLLDVDLTPCTAALLAEEIRDAYPRLAKFAQRDQLIRVQALLRHNRLPLAYQWLEEFLADVLPLTVVAQISDEQLMTKMYGTVMQLASRWHHSGVLSTDRRQLCAVSPDAIFVVCLLEKLFYIHRWQLLATQRIRDTGDIPDSLSHHEFAHTIYSPAINDELTAQFAHLLNALCQEAQQTGCGAEDILL